MKSNLILNNKNIYCKINIFYFYKILSNFKKKLNFLFSCFFKAVEEILEFNPNIKDKEGIKVKIVSSTKIQ